MAEMRVETFGGHPIPNVRVLGEMWIPDDTGHSRRTWDSHDPIQVADAKRSFDDLRAKGFVAHKVSKDGKPAEIIHTFDPQLELMILSPAPVGG